MDATACANCARTIDGEAQKFCPACGQPTPAHRIDWHYLGHELEHGVLHMDRGFLFTARQLFSRPGHFIRGYIRGARTGHVKPVPMLVMTAAILLLLGHYLLGGDVIGSSFTAGMEDAMADHPDASTDARVMEIANAFAMAKDWMNKHLTLLTLLLLPAEALAFKWAFRRFSEINFPEWLVITTYLTAQTFMIWALAVPFQRYWPDAQPIAILVAVAFNVYSLMQYFRGYPRWQSILRALIGFGLFQLFNMLLMFVGGLVIALRATSG